MRSLLVIDVAEGIELELQVSQRLSWSLLGEEELQGLVETFNLTTDLGMIGSRVNALNTETIELRLEDHAAAP